MTEQTAEPELTGPQRAYNVAQSEMFQLAAYGHHRYHPSGEALTDEGKRQQRDYNDRIRAAREQLEATLLRLVAEHAETFTGKRVVSVEWLRSLADDPAALSLLAVRPDERDFDTDPAATPAGPAPATDRGTAPTDWIDGHPQLEAIAAAVWEKCGRSDSGMCVEDDPRNIAVAALDAVLPAPVDRAAVLLEAADRIDRTDLPQDFVDMFDNGARWATSELRRLAGEEQQDPTQDAPTPAAIRADELEATAIALEAQTCTCGCRRAADFLRQRAAVTRATTAVARPGQPETDEETDRA